MDQTPIRETSQPIPENSSSPPAQNPSIRKIMFTLVGSVAFVTIAVVFSSILLNNKENPTPQNIPSGIPTNALTAVPTPVPTQSAAGSKLHIAEDEMFFIDQPYPAVITNLPEAALIGFSCGETYSYQYDQARYVHWGSEGSVTGNSAIQLADPTLQDFLTKYNNQQPKNLISTVQQCILDTNQTILIFEITAGGGGMGTTVHVGYFENGTLTPNVTIKNEGDINTPYFTFGKLLAITMDNHAFITVHGGDAFFGRAAIVKVDLSATAKAPTPIYICTLEVTDMESNDVFPETKTSCT